MKSWRKESESFQSLLLNDLLNSFPFELLSEAIDTVLNMFHVDSARKSNVFEMKRGVDSELDSLLKEGKELECKFQEILAQERKNLKYF